jgi:hypothetical protein
MMSRKLCFIFFILISHQSFSQNNEGEIEDAQILIEKNSAIILPNADKSINKIIGEVSKIEMKKFKYDDLLYSFESDDKKIDRILRNEIKILDDKNIFLDLGYGNYGTFLIHSNPSYVISNKFSIYSDIFHLSSSKGSKLSLLSGKSHSDINLKFNYKLDNKNNLRSYIKYQNNTNGYYGFVNSKSISKLTNDQEENYSFKNNVFDYNINWENISDKLISEINVGGREYVDNLFDEYSYSFKGNLTIPISQSILSISPYFKSYNLKNVPDIGLNDDMHLNIDNFSIPLSYEYFSKRFTFNFNLDYQIINRSYKSSDKKTSLSPSLKLKYNLNDLTFMISASKGLDHNTYYNEIQSLPFIHDPLLISEFNLIENKYTFMGAIDMKVNDDTQISFSYETKNLKGSLDYILSNTNNLDGKIRNPLYLYTIERNPEEEVIDKISLEINSSINNNINSSFKFIYNIYEEKEVLMPVYLIEQVNTLSFGKLDLTLGGIFELENYGINFKNEMFKMNSYIDIFSESSYQISESLNVYIKINNILNKYNERFFMYPDQGINFMLGIKWNF